MTLDEELKNIQRPKPDSVMFSKDIDVFTPFSFNKKELEVNGIKIYKSGKKVTVKQKINGSSKTRRREYDTSSPLSVMFKPNTFLYFRNKIKPTKFENEETISAKHALWNQGFYSQAEYPKGPQVPYRFVEEFEQLAYDLKDLHPEHILDLVFVDGDGFKCCFYKAEGINHLVPLICTAKKAANVDEIFEKISPLHSTKV